MLQDVENIKKEILLNKTKIEANKTKIEANKNEIEAKIEANTQLIQNRKLIVGQWAASITPRVKTLEDKIKNIEWNKQTKIARKEERINREKEWKRYPSQEVIQHGKKKDHLLRF